MYISNVELKNGNKVVFKEKNSFHLIDFSDTSTTSFLLTNKKVNFTSISFQVGVDSSTTLSGALGGDLDPTKGMYWTWQTGYIHFKLEGINNFKTKKDFVYHIGGFQHPNNTLRKIELKT
ncbi:MAG: MbnP family protein, partial [Fluviicola sp.]